MTAKILVLTAFLAVALLYADAVTYTYDDAGRLTSVSYPNGSSISYTYDAAGNLLSRTVTGASGSAKKLDPKDKPASKEKVKSKDNKNGKN